MQFPKDHFRHDESAEWWYYWGRFPNGTFFTLAEFMAGKGKIRNRATHWSLHNGESQYFEELCDDFDYLNYGVDYIPSRSCIRFSIQSKHFGINMIPNVNPIIHESVRNYYSIPSLQGEGHLGDKEVKVDAWMDHEFGSLRTLSSWDWIAVKLNCGMNLMATETEQGRLCMVEYKGNTIKTDFILDDRHLFFHELMMHFTMRPLVDEKIFKSRFGMPYSEVPFEVIGKGEPIGYGIREKAYKEKENG